MQTVASARAVKRTLLTCSVLAVTTAVSAQDPPPPEPPSSVDLSVVLRDFSRDHEDFNVIPADGYGYYAGNVDFDLDESGKPVFSGGGYRVQSLWRDANGQPIAPHLFNLCNFVGSPVPDPGDDEPPADTGATSFFLSVSESVTLDDKSVIDSFDSNAGRYDKHENAGEDALVMVNGTGHRRHYVTVKDKSTIKGDVLVHPDDDPGRAIRLRRRSTITGETGNMETPLEFTAVALPEMNLGDSSHRKFKYKRGHKTISESVHCREVELTKGANVTLEGDITIWCDDDFEVERRSKLYVEGHVTIVCGDNFELDDKSEVRIGEDASLTIYAGRRVEIDDRSKLNMNTGNPQLVSVHMLNAHRNRSRFTVDDGSDVCAWVNGAEARLSIDDRSEFYGSFMGRRVDVDDRSKLHLDMATGEAADDGGDDDGGDTGGVVITEPEDCDLGDVAGIPSVISDADITSAETFGQWWRDMLGVNMTTVGNITMSRDAGGTYAYLNDDYRPLDGQLLGNEGDLHNYHFTLEMDATFTYDAAAAQWLEFRGSDDTYVFINGRLVLDLGGYGYNKVQYLSLDRLGLPDGESARLQLFHAQRQRGLGIFRLRTNLVLADNTGGAPSVNSVIED